jgi:hypothetical protein
MVKIFGDVEALEKDEDTAIETFNKKNNTVTRRTNQEVKRKATQNDRECRRNKRKPNIRLPDHILNVEPSPLVDFILRPYYLAHDVERLNREKLRTSKDIKISNLRQFLSKKLDLSLPVQILIKMGTLYVRLEDDTSLQTIITEIMDQKDKDSILMLYYKRDETVNEKELPCDSR